MTKNPPRTDRFITIAQRVTAAGALLMALFIATPMFWDLVDLAGYQFMRPDMRVDYALGLAWALFLGLTILLWPVPRRHRRALLWIWLAKGLVTLGFMLLYEWKYGGDAGAYFNYCDLFEPFAEYTFGQGTNLMYSLAALHKRYVIADSYHAMKVTWSMLGLVGVYVYFRAAILFLGREELRVLYVIGVAPSVLIWSSMLGKDPITMLGVSIYVLGVLRTYRQRSLGGVVLIGLGVLLTASVRSWMAAICLAPLLTFWYGTVRGLGKRLAFATLSAAGFVGALFLFSDRLQLKSVDDVVNKTTDVSRNFAVGGSASDSGLQVENSPLKMLAFSPLGMVTALFRPFPGEIPNVFGILASLENALLVWLAWRAYRRTRARELKQPVLLWALALVLVWAFVYGFVCFANLGTSVRYRLQIFPVELLLLLYLARRRGEVAIAEGASRPALIVSVS